MRDGRRKVHDVSRRCEPSCTNIVCGEDIVFGEEAKVRRKTETTTSTNTTRVAEPGKTHRLIALSKVRDARFLNRQTIGPENQQDCTDESKGILLRMRRHDDCLLVPNGNGVNPSGTSREIINLQHVLSPQS